MSASSTTQVYTATNANDGNLSTYWEGAANAYPGTLTVDLGSDSNLSSVVIKLNPDPAWTTRTQTLSVLGKIAGTSGYSTLKASATYVFVAGSNSVSIPVRATARYVQLAFTANSGASSGQVAEFEVWGTRTGPFGGANRLLADGSTIQVEGYDLGGQGVGYFDTTTGNSGGGFRADDVDLEVCGDTGGGYDVTNIADGEWLNFTVNATAGTYTITARVASVSAAGSLQMLLDGVVLGSIPVSATGGAQTYVDASLSGVVIPGGNNKVLQLRASNGGFKLNYVKFATSSTPQTYALTVTGGSGSGSYAAGTAVAISAAAAPSGQVFKAWTGGTAANFANAAASSTTYTTTNAAQTLTATYASVPVGINLAIGKPIAASSTVYTFVAANANDSSLATYWEGAPGSYPNNLTISLGADASLSAVVVKLNPDSAWATRSQTIQIMGHAQGGTTFINLVSAASYTFNPATGNSVTIPVSATVSDVRLVITANSGSGAGQVAEFQILGTPAPSPDLQVTGLNWTPTAPLASAAISLTAVVANGGNASAGASSVNFYLGSNRVGSAATPALAPGASANVSASIPAQSAGSYSVTAKVDEANIVAELNEANNSYTASAALVVSPVASSDLVGTLAWTPVNPSAGTSMAITIVLTNKGTSATAAGAHPVALTIKSATGTTVATLNGTYSGSLAPGASASVALGSWVAANGGFTFSCAIAADANELPANQANNTFDTPFFIGRGAAVPCTRYEADLGTLSGGATVKASPTFDYAQLAAQASDQKYVDLPSSGSAVEWTVNTVGAGVNMRFTLPDTADGMGQSGSLDCYVNGVKVQTVALSSYWMWQYFAVGSDQPMDAPNGGLAAFAFDEVHWKLATALKVGDRIRIQSTGGLDYGIDFLEIEPVPDAIVQPAGSISVADFGAKGDGVTDNLAAFNSAVTAAAASSSKTLYIPAGTWNLSNMWVIGSVASPLSAIKITGAGMWHTNLKFTNPNASSGGLSFRMTAGGALDFGHVYINSSLRTRYNQQAVYKCFMDNFGTNSRVHDFWEEHFECGFWVGDYAHTPAMAAQNLLIENGRVRNNLADGVNFCQGTSNSTVQNCSLRNNGDDSLAVWPDNTMGAPMAVNNTFTHNTIENNWRAGGIAFFGGSGHRATFNYIKDTFMGSGFRANTVFPGYHFDNNTAGMLISDTTIIGCGTSHDCYNGERGAIDLEASNSAINNFTFTNIDLINTQRDAVQFGYSGGFTNVVLNSITINGTGLDKTTTSRFSGAHLGSAFYAYTGNGSATVNGASLSNIANPSTNFIQSGFILTLNGDTAKSALTVLNGSGSGSYAVGSTVTITANAAPAGQVFDAWIGGTDASFGSRTAATTSYTIGSAAVTLTATYKAQGVLYPLTVNGGSGGGSYAPGSVITITANVAPAGQVFDAWTGGTDASFGSRTAATTSYTTGSAAVTLTATYKAQGVLYLLTVNGGSGGGSYAPGSVVILSANAAPAGQVFDAWIGGTDGSFASRSASITSYTTLAAAQTVTATYKASGIGSNLATGKAIAASSTAYSFVAGNANDGSTATYWEGAAGSYPNNLTVALGADADLSSLVIALNPGSAWSARTQTIEVQGRQAVQTSFTSLKAAANYSFDPASGNTVTIPVSGRASDVRLVLTANTGSTGGQVAEFQIIGTPAPNADLRLTGLNWSPAAPIETDAISLTAAITNGGSASAAASKVNFYLGTTLVGSAATPALAVGASANVSASIAAQTAGSYSLTGKINEAQTVTELDYSNNSFTAPTSLVINQVSSSDLVGSTSWTPSNPSAGSAVNFTLSLLNQGTAASAAGSHAITLVLKDQSGAVLKTLAGTYTGSLASGASVNVDLGTWTAANGSYTLISSIAVDANELAVKQANNVATTSLYCGRGANMPYTKIEAESPAVATTGTRLTPNFKLADLAGEASGRSAVRLDATGQYVEFTLTAPANTLVMRNAVPEGSNGTVSLYINGASKGKLAVSSDFSYVYASPTTLSQLGYNNTPGGTAYWLYEDAHQMLDQVYPVGSKIRIQKDAGDVPWICVDFLQTEHVAPAASNPDPTKYVEVSTSKSIDTALTEFRQDTSKLGIFIPAGDWEISSKIFLYGRATQIIGAGPWHTRLRAPSGQDNTDVGFNIGATANGTTIKNLSAWGNYKYRIDGPGKFLDGSGMQNVTIDNVWIEHFICMYWGVGSSHNTFKNCRVMNTFADGINMTNGSSYNVIDNCEARGNGDDAFALFSAVDAGGSYNVGNTYSNCTATCTRRAANFAVYGGSGNTYKNLYGADTLTYPGITISSLSFGYNTLGFGDQDCVFDGITLDRTGGDFWTSNGADDKINDYQNFGAIWLFSGDRVFKNIVVKNVDINNPVYFGLMFQGKATDDIAMQNVRFENITINKPTRYGIKLVVAAEAGQIPVRGEASFSNVKISNAGVAPIYGQAGCPNFVVTKLGTDNNW